MTGDETTSGFCGPGPSFQTEAPPNHLHDSSSCVLLPSGYSTGCVLPVTFAATDAESSVSAQNSATNTDHPFQPWVNVPDVPVSPPSSPRTKLSPLRALKRKSGFRKLEEMCALVSTGKIRELKTILRDYGWPVHHETRSQVWYVLCSLHSHERSGLDAYYWDTVKQLYGTTEWLEDIHLPAFVDPHHVGSYHLKPQGIALARRVTAVLAYSCPDITYAPSIYPIACILLHYLKEEETYTCLYWLVASKALKFITQTKLHYETIWRTAMILTKKHMKSAANSVTKQCGGDAAKTELFYQSWLWFLFTDLPFPHLVRIMDCFLCEGRKVMYRVWLALLHLFYKNQTTSKINGDLETSFANFCRDLPLSPNKLLKLSYSIRNFRTTEIDRLFIKTEMYLKSRTNLASSASTKSVVSLVRSRSTDALPTSQSQVNVQMLSHTLTIKELITLWSWLPIRITMYQPFLLYTTEEHGCSLTTFYTRVERHEPTLLLIKTCAGDVFGAYCSTKWADRNSRDPYGNRQAYFGTGETFVFSLVPDRVKYPWVGISQTNSPDGPACMRHAAELFMAGDQHMLTIGGGKGQALLIDEDVRFGKTDYCLTFNNPPLCPQKDFEIRVIEVFGFAGV